MPHESIPGHAGTSNERKDLIPMKKFMNRMAKKEGFTLVELIVVIAILAILAGVAVPAYSAYIDKANTQVVKTELENARTAAIAECVSDAHDEMEVIVILKDGTATAYLGNTAGATAVSLDSYKASEKVTAKITSDNHCYYFDGTNWNVVEKSAVAVLGTT